MGMLFCYTVFGRRSKTPILGASKTGLKAIRKGDLESRGLSERADVALVQGMDKHSVSITKDDGMQQDVGAEFVIDCNTLINSVSCQQLGSEKFSDSTEKVDVNETVVDIHKLSSLEDPHPKPEVHQHDLAKSDYEPHVWSSCSQGTFQGDVSLSVGEGTISSNGHPALLPQQDGVPSGGSLGACEDASSEASIGEYSNRSLHHQGFHEGHSVEGARATKNFAFAAQYYDDEGAQVALDQPFTRSGDIVEAEGCPESAHLFSQVDPHVHNDDIYSGHASDPGFYEREVLKTSPSVPGDESDSPWMGVFATAYDAGERASGEAGDEKAGVVPPISSEIRPSNQGVSHDDSNRSFARVKEWIDSIHQTDMDFGDEEENLVASGKGISSVDFPYSETGEASAAVPSVEHASVDHVLAHAAVRSLHPSSTVAHLSGIGLREVPPLGMFSSLRTLNLSANLIAHVPVGCLPRSLHSLDLSRNRIAQIEGFRELTRLRVLNLSHNRISRIGHGLANCTLIKELYLAGNKIGEVEGLHRLLKLAVLDLSFNKLTTSKALGQLAANYGSLLALNLLGNPILTNFSEDQMRKLVTALAPHVTYLNKQPIKVVSVREAALDSVARAALGTSQRYGGKSRDVKAVRKAPGAPLSLVKKKPPPHQHSRHSDKKLVSASSSGHHHHHHHAHGRTSVKGKGAEPTSSKVLGGFQNIALDSGQWPMHRSRSASILQE